MLGDKILFKPNHYQQASDVMFKIEEQKDKNKIVCLIGGCSGTGKCLAKGTRVMMADGNFVKVENIRAGFRVMNKNNGFSNVLSRTSGVDQMYRVSQLNGDDYVVNSEHILSLYHSTNKKYIDIPVKEYMKLGESNLKDLKGYKTKVDFRDSIVKLDPYFLGMWLGDGRSRFQSIATMDKEVVAFLESYAKKLGYSVSKYDYPDRCPEYNIANQDYRRSGNEIVDGLRFYGLLMNKHIPSRYLKNSRYIRYSVLAGLLDSDGHLTNNCFDIVQVNHKLAEDIVYLSRSLGLRVSVSDKIIDGKIYKRMTISGDTHLIPTKIERKKASIRKINKNPLVCGISVTPIGNGEYYGFTLEGDKHFILEDFTVTHNTETAIIVQRELYKCNIHSLIVSLDDYYDTHWKDRDKLRKERGIDNVGVKEIEWDELKCIINDYTDDIWLELLRVNKYSNQIEYVDTPSRFKVLIIEGLYAGYLKSEAHIFHHIEGSPKETYEFRKERGKENPDDEFRKLIIEKEYQEVLKCR